MPQSHFMLTEQGRAIPTIAIYKPQHLLCTPVSGVHGAYQHANSITVLSIHTTANERAKGRAVYSRVVHGDLLESHDPQTAQSDNLTKQIIIRTQVILQRNPTRGQADEGLPRDDHTTGDHFLQSIAVSAQRKIPDGLCCRLLCCIATTRSLGSSPAFGPSSRVWSAFAPDFRLLYHRPVLSDLLIDRHTPNVREQGLLFPTAWETL